MTAESCVVLISYVYSLSRGASLTPCMQRLGVLGYTPFNYYGLSANHFNFLGDSMSPQKKI